MAKLTKKQKAQADSVNRDKFYGVDEAIALVKKNATAKFDETVEIALNLGVDPRHADQMVRGVVNLPKGSGKPGSTFCVCALNALQNSMMFRPRCPSAGPIGGEGFALPAGT